MTHLKHPLFFPFILMLVMGLAASVAQAQVREQMEKTDLYQLTGKVVDANTGEALSDVKIEMTNPDVKSGAQRIQQDPGGIIEETTDDQGEFSFMELPPGEYTVMIDFEDYETWERDINLKQDSQLTIELQPMK